MSRNDGEQAGIANYLGQLAVMAAALGGGVAMASVDGGLTLAMLTSLAPQVAAEGARRIGRGRKKRESEDEKPALRAAWERAAAQAYGETVAAFPMSAQAEALPVDAPIIVLDGLGTEEVWEQMASPGQAGLAVELRNWGGDSSGVAEVLEAFVKFAEEGDRFSKLVELRFREELKAAAEQKGTAMDVYLKTLQEESLVILSGQKEQLEALVGWVGYLGGAIPEGLKKVEEELATIRKGFEEKERKRREVIKKRERKYLREVERMANKQWFGLEGAKVATAEDRPDLLHAYISMRGSAETEELRKMLGAGGEARGMEDWMTDGTRESAAGFATVRLLGTARRLVLTGEGGDGKSAFAAFLAVACARQCRGEGLEGLEDAWEDWPVRQRLCVPFFLRLRDLGETFGTLPGDEADRSQMVVELLRGKRKNQSREDAVDIGDLLEGHDTVVVFDGLDELPKEKRENAAECIAAFAERFERPFVLVTTRPAGWEDIRDKLVNCDACFEEARLEPLIKEEAARFIRKFYPALDPVTGAGKAEALIGELLHERWREDWGLATNPLLLTLLVLVHRGREGELPGTRVELYETSCELLLGGWDEEDKQKALDGMSGTLQRLAELSGDETGFEELRRRLRVAVEEVNWRCYSGEAGGGKKKEKCVPIPEADLEKAVRAVCPVEKESGTLWDLFVRRVRLFRRAGKDGRGRDFFEPLHRTFQEFLAGAVLSREDRMVSESLQLLNEEEDWWRNAVCWAALRGAYVPGGGGLDKGRTLIRELLGKREEKFSGPVLLRLVPEMKRAFDEAGLATDGSLLDEVREFFRERLESEETGVGRNEFGMALARLGDPRRGVGLGADGLPDIEWVALPRGWYPNGSLEGDEHGFDDERPAHWVRVGPLEVSRWPVTVAQFAAFIDAGGYEEGSGWWIEEDGSLDWLRKNRKPWELSGNRALGTMPRTEVSWYEAMAFCRWLESQVGNEGWEIQLPSEAEWEATGRVGERADEPKGEPEPLAWPWKGEDPVDSELRPRRINMVGSGIGGPSVAGAFPEGAIGGAEDLLGNVWEWCLDRRGDYPAEPVENPLGLLMLPGSARALRGGSYWGSARDCRCAYRLASPPGYRGGNVGFRLVRLFRQAGPQGAGGLERSGVGAIKTCDGPVWVSGVLRLCLSQAVDSALPNAGGRCNGAALKGNPSPDDHLVCRPICGSAPREAELRQTVGGGRAARTPGVIRKFGRRFRGACRTTGWRWRSWSWSWSGPVGKGFAHEERLLDPVRKGPCY